MASSFILPGYPPLSTPSSSSRAQTRRRLPPSSTAAAPAAATVTARPPPASHRSRSTPHIFCHPSGLLLEMCAEMRELYQFLPLVIKNGLDSDPLFQTKLLSLFSRFGSMHHADLVFQRADHSKDEFWHSMLKGHSKNSSLDVAFAFFCRMRRFGVQPLVYNFTYLLKNCGDQVDFRRGKQIHGKLISCGFESNVFAMTAVVNMYAKCSQMRDAQKMFDRMPQRDVVAWNALVSGYAQNGLPLRAIQTFGLMQTEAMSPDSITIVSVLPACADTGCLKLAKSIHGYVVRVGFESLVNVATAIVDVYSKCGHVNKARLVFDRMPEKNVVSWNTMIDGYARNGDAKEALKMFQQMQAEGLRATDVTFMAALHACANMGDLAQGRYVHDLVVRDGFESDVSVNNSLIAMYSKCKRMDLAAEIFKKLHKKTLVSWNAIISGYTQNDHVNEALHLFSEMQKKNLKPDSFTLVSIIPAFANLSVLRTSKWVHGHAIRLCLHRNVYVVTALIDMYAKSGSIKIARKLFDMTDERHVTTWNAMIEGYGTHGFGKEAVSLFNQMKMSPVKPNDVTFLCLLSACGHSGLVDEGREFFNSMSRDYGVTPHMDHYATMVDLLGRAGLLDEAWDFIQAMPIEPGISVFGALLGACKIHKNVELGEKAATRLFELEPEEGGYYVLLANIYATASMWGAVARVRNMMEKKGIQKMPGCTLIQLKNEVHTFYSGSTSHPQTELIYKALEELMVKIKAAGYVPDTNSAHDVEDYVKEQLLNTHSEKLAIAFGLINTSPGTTVHIRKNLRVCADCHTATKFISKVTNREIIVRDMHRFHHFKDGFCSCGDYW
ncbi:pentatricopeptide repeat-containing protein At1g11290, chloroplastic-like [Nymphaea colorata]|nr:pentatricopeptide repeat-containing protein At1g11290, chloroplastic-like [Nymphaea colorata]